MIKLDYIVFKSECVKLEVKTAFPHLYNLPLIYRSYNQSFICLSIRIMVDKVGVVKVDGLSAKILGKW